MANFSDQPAAIAWQDRPSTYLICGDDNAVHPDLQRLLARRATTSRQWATGHSPFLSQPHLLATFLGDVAASVTMA